MVNRRDVLRNAAAAAAAAACGGLAACAGGAKAPGRAPPPLADPSPGRLVPPEAIAWRPAGERGSANHGWLDTRHTFSFASYYDPRHTGFRALAVINEDRVTPGDGFPMHPHRDMEIVTYVLEGALEHRDTLGNGSVIRPGEIQRMSAGRGIRHSEYNPSRGEGVHFLQIWIEPDVRGADPSYEQKVVPAQDRTNRLRLVASGEGRDGSVRIHSSSDLRAAVLEPGRALAHEIPAGRGAWVHVARGDLVLNGRPMRAGDGAGIDVPGLLEFRGAGRGAEFLLFDLA